MKKLYLTAFAAALLSSTAYADNNIANVMDRGTNNVFNIVQIGDYNNTNITTAQSHNSNSFTITQTGQGNQTEMKGNAAADTNRLSAAEIDQEGIGNFSGFELNGVQNKLTEKLRGEFNKTSHEFYVGDSNTQTTDIQGIKNTVNQLSGAALNSTQTAVVIGESNTSENRQIMVTNNSFLSVQNGANNFVITSQDAASGSGPQGQNGVNNSIKAEQYGVGNALVAKQFGKSESLTTQQLGTNNFIGYNDNVGNSVYARNFTVSGYQAGERNDAKLSMMGEVQQVNFRQDGFSNTLDVKTAGLNESLTTDQQGIENTINAELRSINGDIAAISQLGESNKAYVFSQGGEANKKQNKSEIKQEGKQNIAAVSYMGQNVGNNNYVKEEQYGEQLQAVVNVSGSENKIKTLQEGRVNTIDMQVSGDLNNLSVYQGPDGGHNAKFTVSGRENGVALVQLGIGQKSEIDARGVHNAAEILQLGEANEAQLFLDGKNNVVGLIQDGVQNKAIIATAGFDASNIRVRQEGHNHQVQVVAEQSGSVVDIHQHD